MPKKIFERIQKLPVLIFMFMFLLPTIVVAESDDTSLPDSPSDNGVNWLKRYTVTQLDGVYAFPPTDKFGVVQQKNLTGDPIVMFHGGIYVKVDKDCKENKTPKGLWIGKASADMENLVPFGIELPPSIGGVIVLSADAGVEDSYMVEICMNSSDGDDFWFDVYAPFINLRK